MNPSENLFFGELLQQFRTRKRLSQKQLAKQIGVSRETVSLWERGYYKPETDTTLYELVRVLRLTEQEQQQLFEAYRITALTTSFHNPPLERNPYFTGRGPQLANLHKLLMAGKQVALTHAIGGLGGIGKTQLALEYAYRYQKSYHDIFWALADTYESLMTSYIHFAALLHLPESEESDQNKVKEAVILWFRQHTGWLLILDNIEDLSQVQQFVPLDRQGAVLLTTRRQVTEPVAQALELGVLSENDGILFLLKRTKILTFEMALDDASAHDIAAARAITQAIGHLPLALDQAGAYILETGCSVANYLEVLQKHRVELLRRRAGREIPTDHPESVTTTFTLSFQQVQQRSKVAAELLRVCAFLAPEEIGEELFVQGASELEPLLRPLGSNGLLLDQAIETLRTFSLIQRDQEKKTLSIHRLVQAVLKDSMSKATRRRWAARVVQGINAVFSRTRQGTQEQRERLLPHALECAQVISAEKVHTKEAVLLLDNCAVMLVSEHNYSEAERLYEEALTLAKGVLGPESPEAPVILNNQQLLFYGRDRYERVGSLALLSAKMVLVYYKFSAPEHPEYFGTHDKSLYALAGSIYAQGKGEQIEQLTQWTLEVATTVPGVAHTEVAVDLENLAELLESLALLHNEHGSVAQAELLYHRALVIREQVSGSENIDMTISISSLASLYKAQGKYEQAEPLFERVLAMDTEMWGGGIAGKRVAGITEETLASDLYNLAQIYYLQGKCEQAESRYEQALTLTGEGQTMLRGSLMMESMEGLTECYKGQGKYEQAKILLQRAMTRFEEGLGPEYYGKAEDLCALASLYKAQGEYDQAESLYKQALAFRYEFVGSDNLRDIRDIGLFYKDCGKYDEAEPLLKQALAYLEEVFERMRSDWPSDLMWLDPLVDDVVNSLSDLAGLYEAQGKDEQAEPLLQRALTLLVDNTERSSKLRSLYTKWGDNEQAEPLLRRVLAISEQMFGSEHTRTAEGLHNLARHYFEHERYEQAEPLIQRAIAIRERVLGPEHLETAKSLHNLGLLYYVQGKYAEAEPLLQRARIIMEPELESEHGDTTIERLYLNELNLLGLLYVNLGRPAEAEPLYQRALSIHEQQLGPQHPNTASSLDNLAAFYKNQRKCEQAEPLYIRALAIRERVLGPEHSETGKSLHRLGSLYIELSKFIEAEPLLRRSLEIYEETLGLEHPLTLLERVHLANICVELGRYEEAESLYKEALPFYDRLLGGNGHKARRNYASLLRKLGREQEAVTLERVVDSDGTTVSEDS